MKKLILAMVFVFATGTTFMNANSTNEEIITPTNEAVEIVEEFGCARDCVDQAEAQTYEDAVDEGELPSISHYLELYTACYNASCAN